MDFENVSDACWSRVVQDTESLMQPYTNRRFKTELLPLLRNFFATENYNDDDVTTYFLLFNSNNNSEATKFIEKYPQWKESVELMTGTIKLALEKCISEENEQRLLEKETQDIDQLFEMSAFDNVDFSLPPDQPVSVPQSPPAIVAARIPVLQIQPQPQPQPQSQPQSQSQSQPQLPPEYRHPFANNLEDYEQRRIRAAQQIQTIQLEQEAQAILQQQQNKKRGYRRRVVGGPSTTTTTTSSTAATAAPSRKKRPAAGDDNQAPAAERPKKRKQQEQPQKINRPLTIWEWTDNEPVSPSTPQTKPFSEVMRSASTQTPSQETNKWIIDKYYDYRLNHGMPFVPLDRAIPVWSMALTRAFGNSRYGTAQEVIELLNNTPVP